MSEEGLSKYLLKNENSWAANIAEELISNAEVRKVLSEPLVYDPAQIVEKNKVLKNNYFKLLSSKSLIGVGGTQRIPFYSVIEHNSLIGWVIKSGATRIPEGQILTGPANDKNEMAIFTKEESLLRIEMAKRIQKIAKESNIDIVLPKKKLVEYKNSEKITEPARKYCVICEKLSILSVEDTVQTIKDMDGDHQKEIARKLATLVKKVGFVDATFDNIRFTFDRKLCFIDTEPAGLMVAKKPGLRNKLFGPQGASVEKCARIGLYTLLTQSTKMGRGTAESFEEAQLPEAGLETFHNEIKREYEQSTKPKLSKWKITLSIFSLGLIPLINVIVALVRTKLAKRVFERLRDMDTKQMERSREYLTDKIGRPSSAQDMMRKVLEASQTLANESFVKEHHKNRMPIAKELFNLVEGVPYTAVPA